MMRYKNTQTCVPDTCYGSLLIIKLATRPNMDVVDIKLVPHLTPDRIKEIFKEAKLGTEDEPLTAEEILKCPTSELRNRLPFLIRKLIKTQIFYNRISIDPEYQRTTLTTTINAHTKRTTNETLIRRYFSNLKNHKYSFEIETYYEQEDSDYLMPHETYVNLFRLMFYPGNISWSASSNNTRKYYPSGP